MRSSLWAAILLVTSCFLASCGGGGNSTPVAPISTTCTLSLSIYADGNASGSGYTIQQSGAPTPAVPRQLDGCTITTLESARLSMCIRHDDPSELTAQLIAPVNAPLFTHLTPNPTPSTEDKSFCDFNHGAVYTMDLPISALASLSSLNARWNASVTDTVQNNKAGIFVSWSLLLSGKKQ